MPGILTNAGVLKGGKITPATKQVYFADIRTELSEGSQNDLGFECGPKLSPIPNADLLLNLEDEKIYPELHKIWVKHYETIANALDIPGNTPLLPICDPTALAITLNVDIDPISVPDILAMIALGPGILPKLKELFGPDIELKLPDLISGLPIPPPVPKIQIPDPNLPKIGLNELFDFSLGLGKLPLLAFQKLMLKMPQLVPNLTLPGILKIACKGVFDAFPNMKSTSNVQIAAANVLIKHTTKMITLTLTGSTVGNGLLVKGFAQDLGYDNIEEKKPAPNKPPPEPVELLDFVGSQGALRDTTPEFRQKLVQTANKIEMNPNFLAAVITLETAGTYSSTIENPSSKAVGLIQFLGFTLSLLKVSKAEVLNMTNIEQLDVVEKYYNVVTHDGQRKIKTVGDAYLAVFAADFIGRNSATTIFKSPSPSYTQNIGFDTNKDGVITVGEVTSKIEGIYNSAKKRGTIPV